MQALVVTCLVAPIVKNEFNLDSLPDFICVRMAGQQWHHFMKAFQP
jgi:hypothetical protein